MKLHTNSDAINVLKNDHYTSLLNVIDVLKCVISLYSSVAEHWSCKPGVESSILSGGIVMF